MNGLGGKTWKEAATRKMAAPAESDLIGFASNINRAEASESPNWRSETARGG
jgi:hypothetical protein